MLLKGRWPRAKALDTLYKIHDIPGSASDVEEMGRLQDEVQLFPETEEALTEQQKLGVKIIIYSDVLKPLPWRR